MKNYEKFTIDNLSQSSDLFKCNCREVVPFFFDNKNVSTMDEMNKNYGKLTYNYEFILRDNSIHLDDNNDLGNILVKVLDIEGDVVHVKLIGKKQPRFGSDDKKIKDISLLIDSIEGYVTLKEFNKYFKKFDTIAKVPVVIQKIIDIAKTIKHSDDYGYVYYNKKDKEIWWVASDGDTDDEMEDIENKFRTILSIKNVIVEPESFPDEDDENWVKIEY